MCDDTLDLDDEPTIPRAEVIKTLVENHQVFLAFIIRRVEGREVAEDILQTALANSVDDLDSIRQSAIAWFYRVLRNAIIDHRRRKAVAERRFELIASDIAANESGGDEPPGDVCRCVATLAGTLKPEYADALLQIEVEGMSVKDYAQRTGITQSNAGVRVFRAREALRKQVMRSCGTCAASGCLDCSCGDPDAQACASDATCDHRHE